MHDITSALIAGGNSNRFGSSKIQANFQGKRLIDYALHLGREISDRVIIIAGKHPLPKDVNEKTYHDLIPNCGPLGGIYTALHFAQTLRVAIIPVDMPLLSRKVYEFLLLIKETERPVVALSHTGLESLVSLWPKSALPFVKHSLERKEFGIYKLLKTLDARKINLPNEMDNYDEKWFLNINTRHDMEYLGSMADRVDNKKS